MKKALFSLLAAAIAAAVPSYAAITGSGTEAQPYVIASDADWAAFADTNNAAAYWASGVHVRLDADVSASTRIGGPTFVGYAGVFDGGGHTATMDGTAPFSSLAGATVRNLRIAGTVVGGNHAGGLTSGFKDGGPNLIENCAVTADITGNRSAGGFVGNGGGDTATVSATLRGCVFAGTIETTNAPNRVGTFWGWSGNLASVKLEDCFDASDLTDPVGLGWGTIVVTNVYYAKAGKTAGDERAWPEAKRGAHVRSVALGEGVSVAGPTNEYATAGVAFVGGSVVRYGDGHFCAPGKTFELRGPSGLRGVFAVEDGDGDDVTADVLAGSTITMPDADVTVSFVQLLSDGDVLTGEGRWPVAVEDGATVTLRDFSVNPSGPDVIGPGVRCLGDATLLVEGENVVNGAGAKVAGVQAGPPGTTLVIRGDGSLYAEGGADGAGIGGGWDDCGDIRIEGGDVRATGCGDAAGIGGGYGADCGDIEIAGGTGVAQGGTGAGIGSGGYGANCGEIVVKGGEVRAQGLVCSAGIGSGKRGFCAGVFLLGGTVDAMGDYYAAGIGCGQGGTCGSVVVSRGVFRVTAETQGDAPFSVGKGADDLDPYDGDVYSECGVVTVGGVATGGIEDNPWTYVGMRAEDPPEVVDLSALEHDFTAFDGATLFGTLAGPYRITVADGATVLLRDVAITNAASDENAGCAGITCDGDATLLLAGSNVVGSFCDGFPGIEAPEGATLEIDGAGSLAVLGRARAAGVRAGAVSIGPGVDRVSVTKGEGADDCIEAEPVSVAENLSDETAGDTRVFFHANDLTGFSGLYLARDGEVLSGTPAAGCAVAVEAGATVTLRDFVLESDWSIAGRPPLFALGDATLLLEGSNVVSTYVENLPAVHVPAGSTLVLDGSGSLDAFAMANDGAGIGGGSSLPCGTVVVRGGVVRAAGGRSAPGIGGCVGGPCDGISIEGGTVEATGGDDAAGIGSGSEDVCGDISISGGSVTAAGGYEGAGIGSGAWAECGDISISGGVVKATGGSNAAGVGAGHDGTCGAVSVSGGIVFAEGGSDAPGIGSGLSGACGAVSIDAGVTRVVADAGLDSAYSVGPGSSGTCGVLTVGGAATEPVAETRFVYPAPGDGTVSGTIDLASVFWDVVVLDGAVLTGSPLVPFKIEIAAGAAVTVSNVTVLGEDGYSFPWAGITCLGDATVALEGTNVLRGFHEEYPGLQAGPDGTTLRILGPGALVSDSNGRAPGIGGRYQGDCGDISIEGGTVTATGGEFAPGIGGGPAAACGDVLISGGIVTATGGGSAPGIGGGVIGRCGDISISGGTVTATGGELAAGIGAGRSSNCGNIEFSGGVTTATGGRSAPAVGSGRDGNCGFVTLADTVTRVTAVAGSGEPPCCIGAGPSGTCGAVTVGGTETGYIAFSPYIYEPSEAVFPVSFDANGGEGSMAGQTFLPGIPQNLSTNEFRFGGKVFLGWSDAADGSGAFVHDGQSFVAVSNTTLYAQWNDLDATLTEKTGWMRLVDGQSLAGTAGTNAHVVVAAGATVTLRGVTILGANDPDRPWAAVTCEGDATIVLEGTNVLRGFYSEYPGLHAGPRYTTLRILGPGSLTADSNGYAPGIGGGYRIECGDISVEGGTIVAVGGDGAAGIGGGSDALCGTVSVSGGTVFAWGGNSAPGVGSGSRGSCDGVAISGGSVAARGGDGAPGIGCASGRCNAVDIADGVSAVLAASGYNGPSDPISATGRTMVGGGLEKSETGGLRVLFSPALSLGENAVAFGEYWNHVRTFAPAEAGWYRFRIPCKASATTLEYSDPIFTVDYAAGGSENFHPDYAPGYELDDFVWLEAGDTCTVQLRSDSAPDLRPLAVERVDAHAVSVDGGTANGCIDTGIADSPVPEGRFVPLTAEADEGFAVGEWIVTDAETNRLPVVSGVNCSSMGFFMPGSNVTVSASFGKPIPIDVSGDPRVWYNGTSVNGSPTAGDPVAAPGAFVEVRYVPTQYGLWTLLAAGVATTNGEPVACSVRELGTEEFVLSFTMPAEPVVVVPAFGRRSYPALREGGRELVTAEPHGTMRSFVPRESGRYLFRSEHGGFDSPTLLTADGIPLYDNVEDEGPDGKGMSRRSSVVELLAGQEYLVLLSPKRDDLVTVVQEASYDDSMLHGVFAVPAEGGTVEVSVSRAFPDHPVAIRAVPDPGYELVGVETYCESGNAPSVIDEWYSPCPFIMMPDEDVTVAAEFRPVYPGYLDDADDFVKANYLAWAARYGKADTDGTHEEAFLLDIDPDTPLDGKALLKITDFAVTPTNLLFEIASDATDLVAKSGPDDGYVNNGVLVIQASTEPDPQTFLSGSPWPVSEKAGRILVEIPLTPGNVPDKAFFRAKLVPTPYGSVFGP